MKRIWLYLLVVIIGVSATSCLSCTPEDVDAFSEGFKEGYFGEDYDEQE